jgi:UDP-3-O-[3-hydroxymyristoyl] glucosamine N-acyltransferase
MLQFSAQPIAMMIQGKVEGDAAVAVAQFGKIEEAKAGELTFLANPKYEDRAAIYALTHWVARNPPP